MLPAPQEIVFTLLQSIATSRGNLFGIQPHLPPWLGQKRGYTRQGSLQSVSQRLQVTYHAKPPIRIPASHLNIVVTMNDVLILKASVSKSITNLFCEG